MEHLGRVCHCLSLGRAIASCSSSDRPACLSIPVVWGASWAIQDCMQLWPVLAIFLGSLVYEKAVQDVASHEQTLSRDAVAASRALLAPASIVGQSPTRVKCKHHRDAVKLNQELEKLKKYIIDGDFWNLKSLLESWKRPNAYVHNLNQLHNAEDYAQMHCSDLDYLARTPVWYEEPKYDSHDDTARNQLNNSTVLELALHMTRKANERVLMGFLYEQWIVGDQFSMARRRVGIVRLLLESGFLWGSGDLICKVVPEENDYRKEVREAFARTVLHDLVRNDVHLNEDQLSLMKKK
ncbi:unnamed protein product [Durusdinium trenchii]|uniref:Uncharacterized protein n=1 Tax=Durusdinium trenchii TaxID=1381693 RepID=A0ABP0KXA9_9DINO